jgi:hypothetical protein
MMKTKYTIAYVVMVVLVFSVLCAINYWPKSYVAGNSDGKYYVVYAVESSLVMNENNEILTRFTIYPYSSIFTRGSGQMYFAVAPANDHKFVVIWGSKTSYCDCLSPCTFTGKSLDDITLIYNNVTFTGDGKTEYGINYIEIIIFCFIVTFMMTIVIWSSSAECSIEEVIEE